MNLIYAAKLLPHQFKDSTILKNWFEEKIYLNSLMENFKELKLIFRGSRDGFSAGAFHDHCNNIRPTITYVEDTRGYIFGGYTSVTW